MKFFGSTVSAGVLRALAFGSLGAFAAGCGGGGAGGDKLPPGEGDALQVRAVTPTNGQETLTDMSDPGLDGKLTLRFSTLPRGGALIDTTNAFNGLTPDVQILNQTFNRVAGTPSLDPIEQEFTFTPAGGTLPNAQYTVTVSRFVSSPFGKPLNGGVEDFSSSWTVGPDTYAPVIRNTSPAANQNEVPLFQDIVITFNESLAPASVVYGQTFFIEDGGTNPPTALSGTLSLKRNNFDIVFHPDPCIGMPSSTTVVVRMLGNPNPNPGQVIPANPSVIRDPVGNGLLADLGNTSAQKTFQFNTKTGKLFPDACTVPRSGSLNPFIPQNPFSGMAVYASTYNRVVAIDQLPMVRNYLTTLVYKPELAQQVLLKNVAQGNYCILPPNVVFGSFSYRADWETKLGRAGEAVIDWRYDPATRAQYIYMLDESDDSVAIINSLTGRVEGRFRGVGSPRGIALTGAAVTGQAPTLFVSNYGQGTITAIPLGLIQPGQSICTAVKELNDDPTRRVILNVGRGPSGIACEWFGVSLAAVVNSSDNTMTIFDPTTLSNVGFLSTNYQVGGQNPFDVVVTQPTPAGIWCWIANAGGDRDETGSVDLWWNGSGSAFFYFYNPTGSILGTVRDQISNPGKLFQNPNGLNCYVPNTSGDTVTNLNVSVQGGLIFTTITPVVQGAPREVGPNPTKLTLDAFFVSIAYVSLAGTGQVAVYDTSAVFGAPPLLNVPGVRSVFSILDQ